ncbi:MAG: histidine phosphatase family protein [Planctomycetes bacterium]|nr:histidine phosphatase family protein [Planctomycetota bacterium]
MAPTPDEERTKAAIISAIHGVVQGMDGILSATITGSFAHGQGLDGISDIDLVVIVEPLDEGRFKKLKERLSEVVGAAVAAQGLALRINATLGPLKFNAPGTAVLHLMPYSPEGHRDHAILSPFTCFDWQRSPTLAGSSLAAIYPVFSLQPRHFFGSRRSASDYLRDLDRGVISFRSLSFADGGPAEIPAEKAMDGRDRHEFGYHVMRFLMQNLVKLVAKGNEALDGEVLIDRFFSSFPDGKETFAAWYRQLATMKRSGDFTPGMVDLDNRVRAFVNAFERQFRREFSEKARRHTWFRHAPTRSNGAVGEAAVFQGAIDPPISATSPADFEPLRLALAGQTISRAYRSRLGRSGDSFNRLRTSVSGIPEAVTDPRLDEIRYGACEGLTVSEARAAHPGLFSAWARGDDPPFPGGGERMADVRGRVRSFLDECSARDDPSLVCTHNVVLRALVGELMGVPLGQEHHLRIPHLRPFTLVATATFGMFLDLDDPTERQLFSAFFKKPAG